MDDVDHTRANELTDLSACPQIVVEVTEPAPQGSDQRRRDGEPRGKLAFLGKDRHEMVLGLSTSKDGLHQLVFGAPSSEATDHMKDGRMLHSEGFGLTEGLMEDLSV